MAEHALPYAMSIAQRTKAKLDVVLVHVPGAYRDDYTSEDLEADAEKREAAYLQQLEPRLAAHFEGHLRTRHLVGLVQETLAAEIVAQQVDLVVMNAHGWGYIGRALVGSVSDFLVRRASVPLLLMHNEGPIAPLEAEGAFRRLLVCLDGSQLAETILEPARAVGELYDAEYRLLRVIAAPYHLATKFGDEAALTAEQRLQATAAGEYLDAVAKRHEERMPRIVTHVGSSANVAAEIVRDADANGADLIALSTHGRGGFSRLLLGSVADKVIRSAKQPVLVCRTAQS